MSPVENRLEGSIPSEINHFQSLEELNLYYNKLTGSIPDMSALSSLRHIDLDGNLLTGQVPDTLFNLPALEVVFLLNNPLTGTIPEITNPESKLQKISLYNCQLSGTIPASLAKATGLAFVQAYNNSLAGSIPSNLTSLPALELFSLRSNDLTGSIPDFAGQTNLETISLGENRLQGTIPYSMAVLPNLKLLYLQHNTLTGAVPDNFGSALEHIWLFGNSFGGTLPSFSANPGTLQQVFLGENWFYGSINSLLDRAPTSIQYLDLGDNPYLVGAIPSSVSKLQSLVYLNVSYTGLVGAIPQDVANLNELGEFDVIQDVLSKAERNLTYLNRMICRCIGNGRDCIGWRPD
jgi:Leucine-rich repeat (LRR) protein